MARNAKREVWLEILFGIVPATIMMPVVKMGLWFGILSSSVGGAELFNFPHILSATGFIGVFALWFAVFSLHKAVHNQKKMDLYRVGRFYRCWNIFGRLFFI